MDEKVRAGILSFITCISIIIAGYFLNQTGLKLSMFLTINTSPLFGALLSVNFVLFMVFSAIALGIAFVTVKKTETTLAIGFITTSYIIGAIICLIAFGQIDFFIPVILAAIGLPITLSLLKGKEKELKYLQNIRASASVAHKLVLFISIGLGISILSSTIPMQKELEENFLDDFSKITFGEGVTMDDLLVERFAEQIIVSENMLIEQIKDFKEIDNLKEQNNPDGIIIDQKLDSLKASLNSGATKQSFINQLKEAKIAPSKEILGQMPLIKAIQSTAWFFYALIAFGVASFFGNLIIVNLAAATYALIMKIFPKDELDFVE